VYIEDNQLSVLPTQGSSDAVGIIAMEAYVPNYYIDADTLEENNIPARTKNGQDSVAVWDGQEDVISMALNAVSMLLERHVKDPRMIGRIEVGTESNVDMSKSIKSYIMDLLPEDHKNVEGVDNTNACYGGAAAMINTLSWCRESEGRYGIVVATDTADMDLLDSSWRGASAVALLIGPNPWIEIQPERTSC
jgi:hydroxymethylglutaryl-CoA synthase